MDLLILHIRYYSYWWSGDSRGQGISSHFIDLVISEYSGIITLTPEQLWTHGCISSMVATDDLVLKHQAISIGSAD